MSSIYTLETDIRNLLTTKNWFTKSLQKELGEAVSSRIKAQYEEVKTPLLRLSKMGPQCPKALWHSIHTPELAEPLGHWVQNKFTIGNFWEAYGLILCKAAGHKVEGEQDELVLDGIKGHRDAVVDGCVLDFKSCSSRQYQKFKLKTLANDDPFGYLDQLDGYVVASMADSLVTVKDRGFFFAIDKQMGHMNVYEHIVRTGSIIERIKEYKSVVERNDPPQCTCETTSFGASGNIKLDIRASYSPFKWTCFPNLRCFLYEAGPIYLTKIMRKPDVREVDKFGNIIN